MPSASPTSPIDAAIAALVNGANRDPFALLGPHVEDGAVVVRAFQSSARAMELRLVATGARLPMMLRDPAGLFEIRLSADAHAGVEMPDYRLRVTYPGQHVVEI